VSPTGGGLRTAFGNTWAQTQLATRRLIAEGEEPWTGQLGRYVALGGNVRANAESVRVPDQSRTSEFDLAEARLYLDVAVIPNRLSVQLDERVAPGNAENLEANVRFWIREGAFYLKAGRVYLPFGWRLEDDTAFVRQLSGINMQTPDEGVELGVESGSWSVQLAASNGTGGGPEVDDGKQLTARAEFAQPLWRLGAGLVANEADAGDRQGAALFAGLRVGPTSWLAEIAYIDDDGLGAAGRKLLASHVEVNWRLRQGHNVKGAFEWLDPDDDVDEDEQTRASLLYEWSPIEFLQVRGRSACWCRKVTDRRVRPAAPPILIDCGISHILHGARPETGEALPALTAHAAIDDAAAALCEQLAREALRCCVARRIVIGSVLAARRGQVVELAVEIGHPEPQVHHRLERADLRERLPAPVDRFGVRGLELARGVPCPACLIAEPRAARRRVAERCHDNVRVRRAGHPLLPRQPREKAEIVRDAIVRPSFELEQRRKILGARQDVENPRWRVVGGDQPVCIAPREAREPRKHRGSAAHCRRDSSRRRTW
jgi:hypothetical protein